MKKIYLLSAALGAVLAVAISANAQSQYAANSASSSAAPAESNKDHIVKRVFHPTVQPVGSPSEVATVESAFLELVPASLIFDADECWGKQSPGKDLMDSASVESRKNRLSQIWISQEVESKELFYEDMLKNACSPETAPLTVYTSEKFVASEWNEIVVRENDSWVYVTGELVAYDSKSSMTNSPGQYQVHMQRISGTSPWRLVSISKTSEDVQQ